MTQPQAEERRGSPAATRSWERQEGSSPGAAERARPAGSTLTFEFWPPDWGDRFPPVEAPRFVAMSL